MKKGILAALAALSLASPLLAVTDAEARSLLERAEQNTSFFGSDFTANCSVVQEKPGEGQSRTAAVMHRRDSAGKWAILITGPSKKDKGKGYLQSDGTVWFYDPSDGRFTFTSARDRFQNTNANTSDFAPQPYARSYAIERHSEARLGSFRCVVLDLRATAKDVEYPRMRLWVTADDGLVRKREDYSLSGQRLRTLAIPSYQSVPDGKSSRFVPVSMVIQDDLRGKKVGGKMVNERTVISLSSPSFAALDGSVYTKPYLEMMSAR